MLNKNLGQHFLIDNGVLDFIARSIAPQLRSHIVEIGPGSGALTRLLLSCPALDLIELDKFFALQLSQSMPSYVKVHQADVLSFDFTSILRHGESQVVGNLPYNISSQIILKILELEMPLAPSIYLVQKEMAERLVAKPKSSHYGRLSVMVNFFAQASYLLDVPPSAFSPAPKVDSALIMLTQHDQAIQRARQAINRARFAQLVKLSFSNKRKQLYNNLKTLITREKLNSLFSPTIRAEELSVEDFIDLQDHLNALSPKS